VFGFGAPSELPVGAADPGFKDWGFGDPTPDPWPDAFSEDYGFGDIAPAPFEPTVSDAIFIFPDDGGHVVRLVATWTDIGPYRIQLIEKGTAAVFPNPAVQLGCYSGIAGQGVECFTTTKLKNGIKVAGKWLEFALPPLPPGVYQMRLSFGPGYLTIKNIDDLIRVVHRNRSLQQWSIRSTFPGIYTTHARRAQQEVLLDGELSDD
jgi:hypothetical protein